MSTPGLVALAQARRWRITRERCDGSLDGDQIVRGRRGSLWDDVPGRCGMTIMVASGKIWRAARLQALAAGFVSNQNGDTEGSLFFDPAVPAQVALAARLADVRPKRLPSPTQLERLPAMREALQNARTAREGGSSVALDCRTPVGWAPMAPPVEVGP